MVRSRFDIGNEDCALAFDWIKGSYGFDEGNGG